jgi:hypothetical protein
MKTNLSFEFGVALEGMKELKFKSCLVKRTFGRGKLGGYS